MALGSTTTIHDVLAMYTDLSEPGRADLTRYLLSERPTLTLANPTLPEAEFLRALDGSTLEPDAVAAAVRTQRLPRKAWPVLFERTDTPWLEVLRAQPAARTRQRAVQILRHTSDPDVADYLARARASVPIETWPEMLEILELAAPLTRLTWLSVARPGEFNDAIDRWLRDLTRLTNSEPVRRERTAPTYPVPVIRMLIELRRDLHQRMLELDVPALSASLAASRLLRRRNDQVRVAGLVRDPALTGPSSYRIDPRYASVTEWVESRQYALLALVNNPRAYWQVVKAVHDLIAADEAGTSKAAAAVAGSAARRLQRWSVNPRVSRSFAEETRSAVLAWLVKRCSSESSSGELRFFDAAELANNPLIRSGAVASGDLHVAATADFASVPLLIHKVTKRDYNVQPVRDAYTTPIARSAWRRRSLARRQRELARVRAWKPSDVPYRVPQGDLTEWDVDLFGLASDFAERSNADPRAYQALAALEPTWELTIGELIDTTLALHPTA